MVLAAVQELVPARIFDLSPKILSHLIDPAARSLAIASLAGLAMAVARVRNLSLRLSVWKAVICVALAMPLLAICLPPLPLSLPVPQGIPGLSGNQVKQGGPAPILDVQPPAAMAPAAPQPIATISVVPAENLIKTRNSRDRSIHVPRSTLALGVYSAGTLLLALRFLLGWFLSYKLRQASRTIREFEIIRRFRCRCEVAELRAIPRLAESDRLSVPLTCGVMQPFVLLPADWRTWDAEKLDAVLAHEVSHVARRDALTERLALLHRSIFWFSPLAWWLPRCLADLAEEASDEAALATGTEPTKYAEILLGFLEDLNSVSCRAHWQGVAMAQAGSAEKRLDRILKGRGIMSIRAKKSVMAVLAFGSVPVVLVAASLQPHRLGPQIVFSHSPSLTVASAVVRQQSPEPAPVPAVAALAAPRKIPATNPAVAPVATARPIPAVSAAPSARATAAAAPFAQVSATPSVSAAPDSRAIPVVIALARIAAVSETSARLAVTAKSAVQSQAPSTPPVPPVPGLSSPPLPPAPLAPASIPPPSRHSYSYSYSNTYTTDRGDSYAIISGKTRTMSGSFSHVDFARLEALRNKINSDFIWFERDGESYVITDPETVKRATEAFAAQADLGRRAGELGERQGSLGEVQGVLGIQQGRLGEQMGQLSTNLQNMKIQIPDMTAELQALKQKTQELSQVISQKDIDEMQTSMKQMQKEIAEATKDLNQAQIRSDVSHSVDAATVEAAMEQARAAIDEQMAKFSAEQSKLGEQQERLNREQAELARQQARAAAKAESEIKAIIDESLSRGIAQPAPKP
jgi:beta-lactamase regulating signal transducer with metallopeptidase domain